MKKLFLLIQLFLFLSPLFSQQVLTIEEAVKLALNNNFSIQIRKNEVEIAKNNTSLGSAGFLPRIDLSGNYNTSVNNSNLEFFDGRVTERTGARSGSLNTGLALNWTLFDGFAMFLNYEKLSELNEISKLFLKSEIEELISNIYKTYYSIVSQKSIVKLAEESLNISRDRLNLANLKISVGSASEIEALQSRVYFNEDSANFLSQKETLKSLKIQLNNILARNPDLEFEIVDSIPLDLNIINNINFDDVKRKNTTLKISEKNIAISHYDYSIIKSNFLPTLSFYGNLGYLNSFSDAGILKSNTQAGYSLGLNLSLNLFNGFKNSYDLENRKIILMNNQLNHSQALENIHSAFTINISNYKKYLELINLEEINITIAKQNLDIATERLNQGVSTPLEFREAQQKFFQAKNRLISAKYYAKIIEADLMKISGLLILDY